MADTRKNLRMPRSKETALPWTALERYMKKMGYVNSRGEAEIKPWAEASGVSPNTLYNWRNHNRVPHGRTLDMLAAHDGHRSSAFLEILEQLAGTDQMPTNLPQIAQLPRAQKVISTRSVPVLSVDDIHRIRFGYLQTMSELSSARTVPAVTTESETSGAFEVRDTSVNRVASPPHYAIIDWADRELQDEAHYLITVEGQPMVRQYHGGPHARWEADSTERYEPIHDNGNTAIDVVGRVVGWYRPA